MTRGETTLRELLSQPEAWRALATRLGDASAHPALDLTRFEEVLVFGSGSSYYLAQSLAERTERELGVRARALPSCDLLLDAERVFAHARRRAAVAISRSGESTEALRAADVAEARGLPLLSVTCEPGGSLARRSEHVLAVPEGREDGLVMLRSFTSMQLAFALYLERRNGVASPAAATLATVAERVIERFRTPVAQLARRRPFDRFVFLGSGALHPVAREAALKVQEMAIATSEAYHSLEYRHGPKSTADEATLVTLFALGGDDGLERDLMRDLKGYGVSTLVVGEELDGYGDVADVGVRLGSGLAAERRQPLHLLAGQLLAYETALRAGRDPDTSRNLTPVVRL